MRLVLLTVALLSSGSWSCTRWVDVSLVDGVDSGGTPSVDGGGNPSVDGAPEGGPLDGSTDVGVSPCGDSGGDGDRATPEGGHDSGRGGDSSVAIELDWVSIPGGTFQMGSTDGYLDEEPVHEVTVPAFEMLPTEVTVAQYGECVAAGPCTIPGTYSELCNWTGREIYADHPVNCVTWDQMVAFCRWAGGRLPSEAEWEYAARSGGLARTYPWGDETATCEYAVMDDGTPADGCNTGRTWEVCSKTAGNTVQGLCDMAGNVTEWVQDSYVINYTQAPSDGSAWEDSGRRQRVIRGGSFGGTAFTLRAAWRGSYVPTSGYTSVGARCAMDAP